MSRSPRSATGTKLGLSPYLSQSSVWALAVGTSVGWGALVVTSNTYLSQAGPLGSVLGLLIGALVMLLVCRNFHYLACRHPDAGGIYTYTKHVFGYDRAFLISWFLSLTYISMFWANATSLPLFARYFFGDVFRFCRLYTIFGYDIYLGEALLTLCAILLSTLLCIRSKQAAARAMVAMVWLFLIGITVCFAAAIFGFTKSAGSMAPAFIPGKNELRQVLRIAFISPWAFIGFEGVTHSSEEFSFPRKKLFRILVVSVLTTTALYVFVTLLSITAYPAQYDSWLAYIRDLGNQQGLDGLPAFYAARHYLGNTGVVLLALSLLALVLTSLIGNLRALSRLFYAVAKDEILPRRFAELNDKQIPRNAMLLVAAISLVIPFVGRTAIGWIVDVTTLGATLLYGFVSAAALKVARQNKDRREIFTGAAGLILMLIFGVYLLLPNLFSDDTLETETYVLLIIWSILGFLYFRRIIANDHARRFGKAIIVWLSLLSLVVLLSMTWTGRVDERATDEAIFSIRNYYTGQADAAAEALGEDAFIAGELARIHRSNSLTTLVVIGLFSLSLAVMLINHFSLRKWERQAVQERDSARTIAYTDPLTGVKSKAAYLEAENAWNARIDDKSVEPFSVVVCDVNGLKHINDTQGHQAGDAYICAAGMLICKTFKHSPVYRIGGDEFVVIPEGEDYENRESILKALNEKIESNLKSGEVVISLGLADYEPKTDSTFHVVFERADARMYERKKELKRMGAITRD